MLTIRRVIDLKDIVRWAPVFRAAGLNANTMRSAMHNKRELRLEEAKAIEQALLERGVAVHPVQQKLEFPPQGAGEPHLRIT